MVQFDAANRTGRAPAWSSLAIVQLKLALPVMGPYSTSKRAAGPSKSTMRMLKTVPEEPKREMRCHSIEKVRFGAVPASSVPM